MPRRPKTPEEAARHRAYHSEWRRKNRDRCREASRRWLDNPANQAKLFAQRRTEAYRAYERDRWTRRAAMKRGLRQKFPALGELHTKELMKIDMYATACKALPAGLPPYVRDDVITDIVLACLEGTLAVSDIAARAKDFLRSHYRMFDQIGTVSLDAPVPGMDGLRYIDRLAAPEQEEYA